MQDANSRADEKAAARNDSLEEAVLVDDEGVIPDTVFGGTANLGPSTALAMEAGFTFKIRVARRTPAKVDAHSLVQQRYQDRGYQVGQNFDPGLLTLMACRQNHVIGTMGIRLDSPRGLAADARYPEELKALRASGARLCEFTRLAQEGDGGPPVLASLFHTAYLYAGVMRNSTHVVIEVNPRHVTFYRRALRFTPAGPVRHHPGVDAPGQLLVLEFAVLERELSAREIPEQGSENRRLLRHGFSTADAAGVLQRLRRSAVLPV